MKKKILIIIGVVVLIIGVIIAGGVWFFNTSPKHYAIYETFDDLKFLDEYKIGENAYSDNKIANYNVTQQINVTIKYNNTEAYFVAYIFDTDENCRKYASEISGNDYDSVTNGVRKYLTSAAWYSHQTNVLGKKEGQCVVYEGNRLYYVKSETSNKKFSKLIKFINSQLPKEINSQTIEERI